MKAVAKTIDKNLENRIERHIVHLCPYPADYLNLENRIERISWTLVLQPRIYLQNLENRIERALSIASLFEASSESRKIELKGAYTSMYVYL